MNYVSISCRWIVDACLARPEVLIKYFLEMAIQHLPENTLGHIKGYAEFDGGAVFASSTLIPPEVKLHQTGDYHGGKMFINVTMIFADQSHEILSQAMDLARQKTTARWHCDLKEISGDRHNGD